MSKKSGLFSYSDSLYRNRQDTHSTSAVEVFLDPNQTPLPPLSVDPRMQRSVTGFSVAFSCHVSWDLCVL